MFYSKANGNTQLANIFPIAEPSPLWDDSTVILMEGAAGELLPIRWGP